MRMFFWANVSSVRHIYLKEYGLKSIGYSPIRIFEELFIWVRSGGEELVIRKILKEAGEYDAYQKDLQEALGPFGKYLGSNTPFLRQRYFRFCPECIKKGRHYIFHDLSFLDRCPVCGCLLEEACSKCGHPMYDSDRDNNNIGFSCNHCNGPMTDFRESGEMLASYLDDPDITIKGSQAFIQEHKDPVLILYTNRLDQNPEKNPELQKMLRKYYLTGTHPAPVLRVHKDKAREGNLTGRELTDVFKAYVDEMLGTELQNTYLSSFENSTMFPTIKKALMEAVIENGTTKAHSLVKLYELLYRYNAAYQNNMHEMSIGEGANHFASQLKVFASFADSSTVDRSAVAKRLFEGLCLDWMSSAREHMEKEIIKEKRLRPGLELSDIERMPMKLPQYAYMLIEREKIIDVCRIFIGYTK